MWMEAEGCVNPIVEMEECQELGKKNAKRKRGSRMPGRGANEGDQNESYDSVITSLLVMRHGSKIMRRFDRK